MTIRVEKERFFNPGTGQILGGRSSRDPDPRYGIRYQITEKTKFSRKALENWWNGGPLAITHSGGYLRLDKDNPPVVIATEIRAAPESMEQGQIPEMPKYLDSLR